LRINAAALKACWGGFGLLWATVAMAGAGTSPPGPSSSGPGVATSSRPRIQILHTQTGLAGTCGGSAFTLNTFISVDTQASAQVQLTVPGVGAIEQFTDETGKNIGPYDAAYPNFQIPGFGGGLAPNTPITVTITTYAGPGLSPPITGASSLTFDCTTGAIVFASASAAQPIPTLSALAMAATAILLGLLGLIALRRPLFAPRKR
jgi:hypothetical protein